MSELTPRDLKKQRRWAEVCLTISIVLGIFGLIHRVHLDPTAVHVYPMVSLADARARRDDAKKLLADGTDPSVELKAEMQGLREAIRSRQLPKN